MSPLLHAFRHVLAVQGLRHDAHPFVWRDPLRQSERRQLCTRCVAGKATRTDVKDPTICAAAGTAACTACCAACGAGSGVHTGATCTFFFGSICIVDQGLCRCTHTKAKRPALLGNYPPCACAVTQSGAGAVHACSRALVCAPFASAEHQSITLENTGSANAVRYPFRFYKHTTFSTPVTTSYVKISTSSVYTPAPSGGGGGNADTAEPAVDPSADGGGRRRRASDPNYGAAEISFESSHSSGT